MRFIIVSLLKQFLFWMLFFVILRITFLAYNQSVLYSTEVSFSEILAAFWHALPVDVAAACYILIVPLVLTSFSVLIGKSWPAVLNRYYSFLMIILYSLITAGEIGIYPEWKTKLSAKALIHLTNPDEVFLSISLNKFMSLLGLAILLSVLGCYFYRKWTPNYVSGHRLFSWKVPVLFILLSGIMFIGMRGGVGPIPISPSAAYYSRVSALNHAAVNSGPHLAISLIETSKYNYENPFDFMPEEEATHIAGELLRSEEFRTDSLLHVSKPNIIIVLLESWSADLIESLGGEPGITPEFASLEKEGILFRQFYSNGSRSQQAMSAMFGGFPATPYTTITENPEKYDDLPSMVRMLNDAGYHSSFFFGGQLTYGNIKAYLYENEFDLIVEEEDIDESIPRGRLGVHDEYLFSEQLRALKNISQPFFSVIFTLSSHSPYDQPMEKVIEWGGTESDFLNSAYYTDRSLGEYMREAREQPWFDSTLFLIVADHSHVTYRHWPLESFEYHKIPLLLYGPALADTLKGTYNDKIAMNSDVPGTLLNMLGYDAGDFKWSRNLFDPGFNEYAYFELQYAFGFKRPGGEFAYGWEWDHLYIENFDSNLSDAEREQIIKEGKAYLQFLFRNFADM